MVNRIHKQENRHGSLNTHIIKQYITSEIEIDKTNVNKNHN